MEDRFGIPDGMFESIDDDFAGAIARIAMLGALAESWLDLLLASLDHHPQSHYAGSPLHRQLKRLRTIIGNGVPARPTVSDAQLEHIRTLLERIDAAMKERNEVLHSVWPKPSLVDGQGWRHLPRAQREAEHEWTRGRLTTGEDLLGLIAEMVSIVREIRRTAIEIEAYPRVHVEIGR